MLRIVGTRATAAAFACILISCGDPKVNSDSAARRDTATAAVSGEQTSPHDFWRNVGLRFDPDSIAIGQRFGPLTVSRLSISKAYDSTRVGSAWFSGEIDLSGRVMRHPDSDVDQLCFEADSLSAARMPRWLDDARRPWFCFRDGKAAGRALGSVPSDSLARIVVDSFVIHRGMSDEVNTARLLRRLGAS